MSAASKFTCDEEVEAIALALFDRTLPKSEWTHRAHFATALWLLAKHPKLDAAIVLPPAIRAYNESTGVANTSTTGYHETITQASIRVARAFLVEHRERALHRVCNELMSSQFGRSEWVFTYWSEAALFSSEARASWCDPDLREFPF